MNPEEIRQRKVMIQNLKDAGCSGESIEEYLALEENSAIKAQLSLLEKHRKNLLHAVHENQKRIDCLDYLMYQVRGNVKTKQEHMRKP